MTRRLISTLALVAIATVICGGVTGCGDDVTREYQHEQTYESQPRMVSPGEPVVGEGHESEPHMVSPGEPIVE